MSFMFCPYNGSQMSLILMHNMRVEGVLSGCFLVARQRNGHLYSMLTTPHLFNWTEKQ